MISNRAIKKTNKIIRRGMQDAITNKLKAIYVISQTTLRINVRAAASTSF